MTQKQEMGLEGYARPSARDPNRGLIIWGASGHALVVADIIRLVGKYEVVGFIDDVDPDRRNTEFCGATILGGREQLDPLRQAGVTHLIFGFGDCAARLRLSSYVCARGFSLASAVVHPRAVVARDAVLGDGTVIAAGAVINSKSRIGDNAIVNTSASVDHECDIGDGVHIGPGAHLAGRVTVGRGAWIGIGAIVLDRVRVGAGALVGAGSVVTKDVPDRMVVYGVPARVRRKVDPE